MSESDEPGPPPTIIKLVTPSEEPPAPGFKATALPQPPPPRPQNLDIVVVDVASGPDHKCRLCGKSVEPSSVQLSYQYSPLIHVKVAFCIRCTSETLLGEAERRFKPLRDAWAAADHAEGLQHGFTRAEMAAMALQGFGGLAPKPRRMSGEFISAAISLAGKLRRDWGSGAAWGLPHDTLKALEALLEALGEQIGGSRRVR
jgi:hypothetical protein